jgi:putative flippase GtrA
MGAVMHSDSNGPDDADVGSALQRLPRPGLEQFIRFGLVGLLNTAVDGGLYFLLTRRLGLGDAEILAKVISYTVAVLNSYMWNRSWTFASRRSPRYTLLPFALVNFFGLAVNSGVMYAGLHLLRLVDGLALILAMSTTFLWNFTMSKLVVFRER